MNKKVYKTMLILTISFLAFLYIMKIFFPEQFMMAIQNEGILKFGKFVDDNVWFHMICGTITSFITYWLYLCAIKHKLYLNLKETLIVLSICIFCQVSFYYIDTALCTAISTIAMVLLSALFKGNIKDLGIIFSFHYMSQYFATKIRSLTMFLINVNYATILLMTMECYFWLLLFYVYNNKKQ